MTDIAQVFVTEEASSEIDALPAKQRGRVLKEIEKLRRFGWQVSVQLGRLEKLNDEIYELRVLGRGPAYRLLCFQLGGSQGRVVVFLTCTPKSRLLGQRRMQSDLERAMQLREGWIARYGGKL